MITKISQYDNMDIFKQTNQGKATNQKERERYKVFILKTIDKGLTDRQKKMMLQYYFYNMTMKDIAKENEVHVSTVSRTIAQGKNKIKKLANVYFS